MRRQALELCRVGWEAIQTVSSWPTHPLLLAPPDRLGLVRGADLELPEPESPWHRGFLAQCRARLGSDPQVVPVHDARGLMQTLRREIGGLGGAQVFGVYGGAGGGRTTAVAALALALQDLGRRVAILDADLGAPMLRHGLGLDDPPVLVESLLLTLPWHGVRVQSLGSLWPEGGPLPWQGQGLDTVLGRFREDVLWGRPDVLLLDLPALGDPRLHQVAVAFGAQPIAVRGLLPTALQGPRPIAVIGQAGGEGDVQLPYAPPGERLRVLATLLATFAAGLPNGSGSSH
jgi:hypothetical protein